MARITIAALQAQLSQVTTERDEALEALHRLRSEVLALRASEAAWLYSARPSRSVQAPQFKTFWKRGKLFTKVPLGNNTFVIREVQQ